MDYSDELLFSVVVIVDVAVAHYAIDVAAAAHETDVVVAAVLAADNASPLPEVLRLDFDAAIWHAAAAVVVAAAVDANSAVVLSQHDVEDAAELPQLHISFVVDNAPDFVDAVAAGALLHAGQPLLQRCWAGLSNFVAAAPYVPDDDVQLQYYLVAYYYFAEALKSVAADEMIASTAIVARYEYDAAAAVHEPPSADDGSSLPADADGVVDVEMLMCSELQPCHSFDVSPPP